MTKSPAPRRTDSKLLRAALASIVWVLVASQAAGAADPACFEGENRYVDCGNGTVTDGATGLVWLQQADCIGPQNWETAQGAAAALADGSCGLTDGSQPGDWRLPTKEEWELTIDLFYRKCAIPLSNDAGTDCLSTGPSVLSGVRPKLYWSSTNTVDLPKHAFDANLGGGGLVYWAGKPSSRYAWPVRDGAAPQQSISRKIYGEVTDPAATAEFDRLYALVYQGDLQQALPLANRLLAEHADWLQAYFQRGLIYLNSGEHGLAKADLNQVVALYERYVELNPWDNVNFKVRCQLERTIVEGRRVRRVCPDWSPVRPYSSFSLTAADHVEQAKVYLELLDSISE